MKNYLFYALILFFFTELSCKKKDSSKPVIEPPDKIDNTNTDPRFTNKDCLKDLLFANKKNYQIETSEAATFSSIDPDVTVSTTGLIGRITSGELVTIDVTWTKNGSKTKLYAFGATDNDYVEPFATYHAAESENPYGQYVKGWETLRRLPKTDATYFIVLRHADANNGKDFSKTTGPANWWLSCESTMARQLNQQGIDRATELGKVFKDLNYPIARVISSEFCRAKATAELIDAGPQIQIDGRVNHPAYNVSGKSLFGGLKEIIKEQPVDNKITLISTHHPINEFNNSGLATFPKVSAFNWTGAYIVKVEKDKSFTYEGAISWGMFKYWRDKKLNKL